MLFFSYRNDARSDTHKIVYKEFSYTTLNHRSWYSYWLRTRRSGYRIPVGVSFSAHVQTSPGAHPASCTMGTGSFPGVKRGRGVTLTPHNLLVPWSRKSRAIHILPLWAVRPVQSLSACTVQLYLYSPYGPYDLYRASVPVQGCTLPFTFVSPGEKSSSSVKLTNHILQVPKLRNLSDALKIPTYYFMGWRSVKKREEFRSLCSSAFAWYPES